VIDRVRLPAGVRREIFAGDLERCLQVGLGLVSADDRETLQEVVEGVAGLEVVDRVFTSTRVPAKTSSPPMTSGSRETIFFVASIGILLRGRRRRTSRILHLNYTSSPVAASEDSVAEKPGASGWGSRRSARRGCRVGGPRQMVGRGSPFLCRDTVLDAATRTAPDGGTFGAASPPLPLPACGGRGVRAVAHHGRERAEKGLLGRLPGRGHAATREEEQGTMRRPLWSGAVRPRSRDAPRTGQDRDVWDEFTGVPQGCSEKDKWSNRRYAPDGVLLHRHKNTAFAGIS